LAGRIPFALSAVLGGSLVVLGARLLILGRMMPLFGISVVAIGGLALALAYGAARGGRVAWAYLIALWGVISLCAFFAAPEVIALDALQQVTPEMEGALGREAAEAAIESQNLRVRLTNLGVCALFALPFAVTCGLLARGPRAPEATE